MENQAFLRSYDLALAHPLPSSPVSKLSLFLSLPPLPAYWQERGGGCGQGAKSYCREKAWPSIHYPLLSLLYVPTHATCAGIFKQSMAARNRIGIGLLYRPARLHILTELVP